MEAEEAGGGQIAEARHAIQRGGMEKLLLCLGEGTVGGREGEDAAVGAEGAQVFIEAGHLVGVQQEGIFEPGKFERRAHGRGEGGFRNDEDAPDSGEDGRDEGGQKPGRRGEAGTEVGKGPAGGAGTFAVAEARTGRAVFRALFIAGGLPAVEGEGYGRFEQGAQLGRGAFVGVGVKGVVGAAGFEPAGQFDVQAHNSSLPIAYVAPCRSSNKI